MTHEIHRITFLLTPFAAQGAALGADDAEMDEELAQALPGEPFAHDCTLSAPLSDLGELRHRALLLNGATQKPLFPPRDGMAASVPHPGPSALEAEAAFRAAATALAEARRAAQAAQPSAGTSFKRGGGVGGVLARLRREADAGAVQPQ